MRFFKEYSVKSSGVWVLKKKKTSDVCYVKCNFSRTCQCEDAIGKSTNVKVGASWPNIWRQSFFLYFFVLFLRRNGCSTQRANLCWTVTSFYLYQKRFDARGNVWPDKAQVIIYTHQHNTTLFTYLFTHLICDNSYFFS